MTAGSWHVAATINWHAYRCHGRLVVCAIGRERRWAKQEAEDGGETPPPPTQAVGGWSPHQPNALQPLNMKARELDMKCPS